MSSSDPSVIGVSLRARETRRAEHTIGVLGSPWRATVSSGGSIRPWDGSGDVQWFVAADDRWHIPEQEPTVRQRRLDGTPVIETRVKVPSGDAIQRVWTVPDGGVLTVIEIENESPMAFAVAFDRVDLLSARPPADVPIQGIDLPAGAVVFPVGHHTTLRFGLAHDPGATWAPERLPAAMQVARGWTAVLDRAGRIVVPDAATIETVSYLRSELA
ncbi:MAG TPA: hypothetical protein PLV68_13870, partial [Ilumatobacteraceae bacterium]|nr:hypothetical protein [Ilumatobacteraceae bacterium]